MTNLLEDFRRLTGRMYSTYSLEEAAKARFEAVSLREGDVPERMPGSRLAITKSGDTYKIAEHPKAPGLVVTFKQRDKGGWVGTYTMPPLAKGEKGKTDTVTSVTLMGLLYELQSIIENGAFYIQRAKGTL